ncbi:MAG: 2-oxo acid dehydrogenase subunit E2 [Actinomycetota bacterium]|nr:2-oxo acid dehydrogenase subunit E2 [Actinomycetota bacterium]
MVEIDVWEVVAARARANATFAAEEGLILSFLPIFAKAAIEALQDFPTVNASIDMAAGTVTYPGAEHLGVAATPNAGCSCRSSGTLDRSPSGGSRAIVDVAERTRVGSITPTSCPVAPSR